MWQQIMPDASREGMMDVESIAQAVLYAVLLPPEANLSELLITPTAERSALRIPVSSVGGSSASRPPRWRPDDFHTQR